eukprot:5484957-Amphidinium_carterae.1
MLHGPASRFRLRIPSTFTANLEMGLVTLFLSQCEFPALAHCRSSLSQLGDGLQATGGCGASVSHGLPLSGA